MAAKKALLVEVPKPIEYKKLETSFGWCQQKSECDVCRFVSASGHMCGCTCHEGQTVMGPRKIKVNKALDSNFEMLLAAHDGAPHDDSEEESDDSAAA